VLGQSLVACSRSLLIACVLQRIPILGVDQSQGAVRVRISRRIDLFIFSRFGVAIREYDDAGLPVASLFDSFVTTVAKLRVHARGWPPEAAAPVAIHLGPRLADHQGVGGCLDRSPLELHRRRKVNSRDGDNLRRIRSHTQEPGVVAVSDLVAVERPVPTQARVIYSAFDGRAMKQVGQVFRIPNNRRAPPVCKRGRRIVAFVLIPVRRKGVAVFIGVELHVNADLPQIVQARGAIRLRFGLVPV